MEFKFTPEQEMMREMIRDFAQNEVAPIAAQIDREGRVPWETLRKAAELDLMGVPFPEEYGGAGAGEVGYCILMEELGRVCTSTTTILGAHIGIAAKSIYLGGSEEQKQKYLAPLARGEVMAGAGVTEPGSGTDVAGMKTRVRRDGDDYILSGSKMWISNLLDAEWFITFGTLDPALRHRGICAFVVEKSWPGVGVHPIRNKTGFRPIVTGELVLDGVRIPRANLIGEEGQGFKVAMCAVENGRLGVAARCVGVMQACLDEALAYAKERVVFGKEIGHYQLIQSRITDIAMSVETARLLTYRLAWLKDQNKQRARLASSMAKLYASEALMKATIDAAQIFGAYACSDEYPVSRHFRDAKFFQVVEGTSELHRILVAEHLLGYRSE